MNEPAGGPAIGIDLGTTTCVAARSLPNRSVECLPLEGVDPIMPSVLALGSEFRAGRGALDAAAERPDTVVESFKRDMGQPHFHRKVCGHWVPPEVLSAFLLAEIRRRIEQHTPGPVRAAITVPAYFDDRRRKATLEAGKLAGLDVLDIVNEPVAAAVAEVHHAGLLGAADADARVLVYDLGGGTFDVSVLQVQGNEVTTLAADGEMRLGGRDFDEKLVEYVAERFQQKHGVDPRCDLGCALRLWRASQIAKHVLSEHGEALIACEFGGIQEQVRVTRRLFQRLIAPFLDRTLLTANEAVKQAGLDWGRLDKVLLVGGSSRIPAVAEELYRATGIQPTLSHAPDLAVAKGAAILASLATSDALQGLRVVNVTAHSIGVAGVNPHTGEPVNRIMIPRNSRLPAAKRQRFVTKVANQRGLEVTLVEGENPNPNFCVKIGSCIVTLAPGLPAQAEVFVTCRIDSNGTLAVSCHVPLAQEGGHVEIRRDGLQELEPLSVWAQRLLGAATTIDEPRTPEMPFAPPVTSTDPTSHDEIVRRLDYLCQQVGEAGLTGKVAPRVLPERRRLSERRGEVRSLQALCQRLFASLATEADPLARARLQADASSARAHLAEAELLYQYAGVAFGRACVESESYPESAADDADEVHALVELLDANRASAY
ncbi:MAG: Hsp70 family protein [Lacipirellulaceae bacterium]